MKEITLEKRLDKELEEELATLQKGTYYYVEWKYSNYTNTYGELEGYVLHTSNDAVADGINAPGQMWTYKIVQ